MDYYSVIRNELALHGVRFKEENGAFQMTLSSGSRVWRCMLFAAGNNIVCCAQFPWRTGRAILTELDSLNGRLRNGCLFTENGHVVLRFTAEITDPLSAGEAVIALLHSSGNTVCSCWNKIFSAAEVVE